MGPVDASHYQGLWELRRELQQEQQQQGEEEEEEEQPFAMELVSISTYMLLWLLLTCCSLTFLIGSSGFQGKDFQEKEKERV